MARRKVTNSTPALTRHSVIVAALEEIDDKGLDNFTLRSLAKRISVYPSSIYWHVKNRDELLAEVLAHALKDCVPENDHDDWRETLRDLFNRFRRAIRRHPNIAPLVTTSLIANASVDLRVAELVLEALGQAGFEGDHLVASYNLVLATLIGFAPQEFSSFPGDDKEVWKSRVKKRLSNLSSAAFPMISQNIKILQNRSFILRWKDGVQSPFSKTYPMTVDLLIAGLEAAVKDLDLPGQEG